MATFRQSRIAWCVLLAAMVFFARVPRARAVSPEEIEQKLKALEEQVGILKQELEETKKKAATPAPAPPAAAPVVPAAPAAAAPAPATPVVQTAEPPSAPRGPQTFLAQRHQDRRLRVDAFRGLRPALGRRQLHLSSVRPER